MVLSATDINSGRGGGGEELKLPSQETSRKVRYRRGGPTRLVTRRRVTAAVVVTRSRQGHNARMSPHAPRVSRPGNKFPQYQ